MKKISSILISVFIISCNSDTEEKITETSTPLFINATTNDNTVTVDQNFTVNIISPENLKGLGLSADNFTTSSFVYPGSGFGNSTILNYRFVDIGEKTLYFQGVKDENTKSDIKSITFNVIKGNCVKIVSLKITSFDRMNTSWDPEYSNSDPNRLADVCFSITKLNFTSPFENKLNQKLWYKSEVKENQGNLTWDLSKLNLYLNPNNTFNFGLADIDNYPVAQDLTMSPPEIQFSLASYIQTKPNSITLSYPQNNLEFILELEWPN
ncbi:MAG: hypothetical protein RLZZ540_1841 [Bacteroidota bacterium]|jgi:hypothetical protein